jgi:hypothetical protein
MRYERWVDAEPAQYDEPDWEPLRAVLSLSLCDWFMWMHESRSPGGLAIHAYKHIDTRRYLHLDEFGCAYLSYERGYLQVDLGWLIEKVFQRRLALPDADADEVLAIWTAIARAEAEAED